LIALFTSLLAAAQADGRTNFPKIPPQTRSDPAQWPVVDGDDIRFSRLSTAQGLSQTRVLQIVQDDQGFMWFGTQYGLDRYDGYEFRVFTHDPAHKNSLSCVYIQSLFKDRSGTLWVGCDYFLDRFEPITETFTHYQIGTEAPGEVASPVNQISQDRAGLLWLATGKGLWRLNPDTGQITHYVHDSSNPFSLSNNEVKYTFEDRSGRFWVIDGDDLEEFARNTGRVLFRVRLDKGVRDYPSLYEDHLGILWVTYVTGGYGSGLAVLDRSTNRLTPYSLYDKGSGKQIYGGFMAVLEDKNKTLWFAGYGAGLLKFDREHKVFIRYRNHPGELESLAEDRLISLCDDQEGNIWAGLHAKEPNFFRTENSPFIPLSRKQSNPNGFGETFVNAVYEDHEGILWTGTTGALNRIDQRTGRSVSYLPPGPGLSNDIIAINEDASGSLWVGTYGGGLSRFDRKTGHYKTYLHEPGKLSSLSDNVVSRMHVDHAGTMWIATWNGLDRFDPETESFVTYKQDKKSDLEQYFNITEDRTGSFWMGTPRTVARFDPKTGQFANYPYIVGDPNSLSGDNVTSVLVDHSGTVWLSTGNGLNKFNREKGTFTHYLVKDGLPTNNVSCILDDQSGVLWMSTSRGLSRFDPVANKFTNYSTVDGLPGNDLTGWDACFKSKSGEMFFGGFSGGVAFFPDKVVDRRDPLPLVLTDFRLAGHSVEVGPHSPLQKSISYANDVTLTHNQNIFSISFAALTFLNPDANRYRYKLEGLEHNWAEVGSDRRVVTYTTLPAGKYTFHVQSATRQGSWGEPGVALSITILPPWWSTWWFRLVMGAFILAFLGSLYKLRLRRLAREFGLRLDERVAERTRIARDLHDTLLQSFQGVLLKFRAVTYIMRDRPDEAEKTLNAVIDQAQQAVIEGRDAVHGLRSSTLAGNDLAGAIKLLGEQLAADHDGDHCPDFRVYVEGTTRDLAPILGDETYRILSEAVRNAFRHAQARRIEVGIHYRHRDLRLRVRDDGKGIDPNVLRAGVRAGHYGLPGMHERVKVVGGRLAVWSKPDSGTEIELTIPGSLAYAKSHTGQ
jgi:signal transduction histidine kinase/ligand-binding sensor domain-containing protein